MKKPIIKVFITKTQEFRAKIKEDLETPSYQVTIGGKSWSEGTGRKFEAEILNKCNLLLAKLNAKFSELNKPC